MKFLLHGASAPPWPVTAACELSATASSLRREATLPLPVAGWQGGSA